MRHENERDRRATGRRDAHGDGPQAERDGVLRDVLRRIVGPREPGVYVMEPDGKVRRAEP